MFFDAWPDTAGKTGVRDLLNVALEKETAARDFYKRVAKRIKNRDIKALFSLLETEENRHIAWVRDAIGTIMS